MIGTMTAGMIPFEWPPAWTTPEALALLRGNSFNTLLFETPPPAGVRERAESLGLRCLSGNSIRWRAWTEMDWKQPGEVVAIKDAFWPSISRPTGHATSEDSAGPTGAPWLDANGWLALMAKARAPGVPVWLKSAPPEKLETFRPESYLLAAMEAYAYGAVRPTWLSPADAMSLLRREDSAVRLWTALCDLLAWTRDHSSWHSWQNPAKLLVVSDFSGPNEYTASETLLLAARRNLAFHPVDAQRFTEEDLRGRRGVLWMDDRPAPDFLTRFVGDGGLLICRASVGKAYAAGKEVEVRDRFRLLALGKGRVAAATADWDDPWLLAQDAHLLLSRRWDPVRLFNAGSVQFHTATAPDLRRTVVHLVNYSMRPAAHPVSLMVTAPLRTARTFAPGAGAPQPARVHREPGRQEIHVPRFAYYLAVELEHDSHA